MTRHFHCLRHKHTRKYAYVCCICMKTIPAVVAVAKNLPMGPVCKTGAGIVQVVLKAGPSE